MVKVRPLSRSDYACASRILRHLIHCEIDREELKQLVCDLLPVFVAQDVNLSLLEPTSLQPNRISIWTLNIDPHILQGVLHQANEDDPILLALRRGSQSAITQLSLGRQERERLHKTESHAAYERETGFTDFALTTLQTWPGEALGRICFHRAKGMPLFDADRALILGVLRSHFSQAVRNIIIRHSRKLGAETALFSSCAEPLWMSDGFPFLWNSVESHPISPTPAAMASLANSGRLGKWVAWGILRHALPGTPALPAVDFWTQFRNGRGALTATLMSVLGWPFGRRDPVLEVRLEHAAGKATQGRAASALAW